MGEVFRGWRRKMGCVTLVMACVFMGGWIRSTFIIDYIQSPPYPKSMKAIGGNVLVSWDQSIALVSDKTAHFSLPLIFHQELEPENSLPKHYGSHMTFWFLGFGRAIVKSGPHAPIWMTCVPYWAIVLPLTLLSAYLILWQPRKKPKPGSVNDA